MTIIFSVELCFKIIVHGLFFNGKHSYLRKIPNLLDFLIVISSIVGLVLGDEGGTGFLMAFRTLRILRPLRIIGRNEGLRVSIASLTAAIPAISRLMSMVVFYVFIFAVLQTEILSGKFYYCKTEHL